MSTPFHSHGLSNIIVPKKRLIANESYSEGLQFDDSVGFDGGETRHQYLSIGYLAGCRVGRTRQEDTGVG
jgi:hypothetical protein